MHWSDTFEKFVLVKNDALPCFDAMPQAHGKSNLSSVQEKEEIAGKTRKGVAICLKQHQQSFRSQLILLEISEAADGQRLFQPWKSCKPLH